MDSSELNIEPVQGRTSIAFTVTCLESLSVGERLPGHHEVGLGGADLSEERLGLRHAQFLASRVVVVADLVRVALSGNTLLQLATYT